jgi:glycine cleavage system aminomethyltransferase T
MSGPKAAEYLQGLTSFDLRKLTFGKSAFVPIEGFNLHVARGGYTGEDGFEVGGIRDLLQCISSIQLSDQNRRSPSHQLKLPLSRNSCPSHLWRSLVSAPETRFGSRPACVYMAKT